MFGPMNYSTNIRIACTSHLQVTNHINLPQPQFTFLMPFRHLKDTISTPSKHPPEISKTFSRLRYVQCSNVVVHLESLIFVMYELGINKS